MIKCREVNDLHHAKDAYLNIVVGNVYDTRFTEQFFKNIQNEKYSIKAETLFKKMDTPDAWNKKETIKTVQRYMKKNSVIVTHMPYEKSGQLFDVSQKSAGKDQIRKKETLPTEKYGGYKTQNIAYCFVVEFTKGKKRVRAIRPVLLYRKELYEKDALQYCKKVLKLDSPKIIYDKIQLDATLELDNKRLLLSGYTATRDTLELKLTNQLFIDQKREQYVKLLSKYIMRCASSKDETLPISKFDGITQEQNLSLYDWFVAKSDHSIYPTFMKALHAHLSNGRAIFKGMPIKEQCELLLKILQAFQCNSTYPNLKCIGGFIEEKRYRPSSSLGKLQTAYLVAQSVTGLYEHKIDLLK